MDESHLFPVSRIFDQDALLFVLLFELRNFSKVAELVGCNQSSVSKRIADFENSLGITLFDRTQRPIAATPEAKVLYYELKRDADALASTLTRLKAQNALKPVVRFGCIETLSLDLVPKLIQKLLPITSRISQLTATSNTLLRLLIEHKLDVIVSSDPFMGVKGLHRRLLFQEPSLILMSEKMAQSKRGPWSWIDLQLCGKPFIYYHLESGGGRLNGSYLSSQYLNFPNQLEVDSNTVMVSLIREDVGWTITRPSALLQTKKLVEGTVAAKMPDPVLVREVFLITRESEEKSLVDECFKTISAILRESIVPTLKQIAPWVADHIQLRV